MSYAQLLASLANKQSGSTYGTHVPVSGGSTITLGGINVGATLLPFQEGNTYTGGYGIDLISRFGFDDNKSNQMYFTDQTKASVSMDSNKTVLYLGIAGLVVLLLMQRKRG